MVCLLSFPSVWLSVWSEDWTGTAQATGDQGQTGRQTDTPGPQAPTPKPKQPTAASLLASGWAFPSFPHLPTCSIPLPAGGIGSLQLHSWSSMRSTPRDRWSYWPALPLSSAPSGTIRAHWTRSIYLPLRLSKSRLLSVLSTPTLATLFPFLPSSVAYIMRMPSDRCISDALLRGLVRTLRCYWRAEAGELMGREKRQ